MTIKILKEHEKQEIEKKLNEQFGIEKIPGRLLTIGKERIFLFSGSLNEKEIENLEAIVPVEKIGIYFGKPVAGEEAIRLSIEGVQILKNQIKKNIFEISDEQIEQWMKGQDLQIKTEKTGFLIIVHKDDCLGCGKASAEKIGNFVPKSRRLKEKVKK